VSLVVGELPASSVLVEIQDDGGGVLGWKRADLTENSMEIAVPLRLEPRRIRIALEDGSPVPYAFAALCEAHRKDGWYATFGGDADGVVEFVAPEFEELMVSVHHPSIGTHCSIPFEIPIDPSEIPTVTIDPTWSVKIRLVDGSAPTSGVLASLVFPASGAVLSSQAPDSSGAIEWPHMARGRYQIRAAARGYWTVDQWVGAVRPDEAPVAVQMRKTGSLDLLVRSGAEGPLAGVAVELESLDLSANLRDWVNAGSIVLGERSLDTDAEGRLHVEGIPNGRYRATVQSVDGAPFSREFEVPRGATANVEMILL
jgi:hypothetical protein